jgi:hypothetical protein
MDKSIGAPSLSRFSDKKNEFSTYKDMVYTYCAQVDTKFAMTRLEKNNPIPKITMTQFLHGKPTPVELPADSRQSDEARAARFAYMHYRSARHSVTNLLNLILPVSFLSTLPQDLSLMDPCDVWKALEATYGMSDAGGVVELSRGWNRLTTSSWNDLGTHFAQLKKMRNEINRKSQALFKRDIVSEDWLCVEVLSQLPSEVLGQYCLAHL